jgi:hypothetical protein
VYAHVPRERFVAALDTDAALELASTLDQLTSDAAAPSR